MVRLVRHRQTKGAETDRPHLRPPRHILILPSAATHRRRRADTCSRPPLSGQRGTRGRQGGTAADNRNQHLERLRCGTKPAAWWWQGTTWRKFRASPENPDSPQRSSNIASPSRTPSKISPSEQQVRETSEERARNLGSLRLQAALELRASVYHSLSHLIPPPSPTSSPYYPTPPIDLVGVSVGDAHRPATLG
jgi:hypothetical protein